MGVSPSEPAPQGGDVRGAVLGEPAPEPSADARRRTGAPGAHDTPDTPDTPVRFSPAAFSEPASPLIEDELDSAPLAPLPADGPARARGSP